MILLKTTEEYRTESEFEAKELMEKMRANAAAEGYVLNQCGYTHKEKKAKGEVVDEAFVVKIVKIFNGVWAI